MPKDKKIIRVKLKHTLPDYNTIHKNYDYPITSFLNGDGYWTYTDVDRYKRYFASINTRGIPFVCHDDGKRCHAITSNNLHCFGEGCELHKDDLNKYPEPSIHPKDLLNIETWKKIYYYQEGENDFKEWIVACKNKDDVYIYFKASCDYTGFRCQGGGDISYSKNRDTFWNLCLDHFGRTLLLAENGIKLKIEIPK